MGIGPFTHWNLAATTCLELLGERFQISDFYFSLFPQPQVDGKVSLINFSLSSTNKTDLLGFTCGEIKYFIYDFSILKT